MKLNTTQFIKQVWVGKSCRVWRTTMDYKLNQVAEETGFSVPTVSSFEHGTNDNMIILLWYLSHGFNTEKDFIEPFNQTKVNANEFNEKCEQYHQYLEGTLYGTTNT